MDENYKGIGERIIDNGYFMRDERLAGPDDGNLDIRNIIDMFSKGISLDEKVVPRDKDLTSVEEIFQEDTPLTESIFGLSEGFTVSPITMLRRYLANKELKKEKEFADGGMAGDKTYHQVRDQFMPMDSESMGYAYGGGIGSMMQPRMNFAGGGGDFIGLNPNGPITIEDLTETNNNGNFLISAAEALPDQTGTINSAPSITNRDLRTIEGSLIDGDDPSSRYAVQQDFKSDRPFDRDFSSFDEAKMGAPANSSLGYQDRIMGMVGNDPFAGMNALEKDIAKQAMNTTQEEFDGDFNSEFYNDDGIYTKQKGEPIFAENRGNLLKNVINKDTNMFGYQKKPTGILTNLKNDIGSLFSSAKDGIVNTGQRFKEGASKVPSLLIQAANYRNPLNPKASNYNPNLVGQLNALDGMTGTVTSGDYGKIKDGIFGSNTGAMLVNNPNSGLLQYGPGSVLRGQGAISGFGTNDYAGQLDKYIDKMKQRAIKKDLSKFQSQKLADAIAERQRETDRQAAVNAAKVAEIRASAPAFNPNTTSGGRGSYRSDRDNSRDGGYGGSSKRSADNRSSDLGFSDIRLKDNIELVGKSPSDINIYNFTYLNDPKVYQGVMAQEVPWASVKHNNGYLMVDYNKVDVDFKRQ